MLLEYSVYTKKNYSAALQQLYHVHNINFCLMVHKVYIIPNHFLFYPIHVSPSNPSQFSVELYPPPLNYAFRHFLFSAMLIQVPRHSHLQINNASIYQMQIYKANRFILYLMYWCTPNILFAYCMGFLWNIYFHAEIFL